MKVKKLLPILAVSFFICVSLAGLVYLVHELNLQVVDDSCLRLFLDDNVNSTGITNELLKLEGVAAVEFISNEQAMIEFENILGYTWPGENPLPNLLQVSIDPLAANQVVESLDSIKGIEFAAYPENALSKIASQHILYQQAKGILLLLIIGISAFCVLRVIGIVRESDSRCAV